MDWSSLERGVKKLTDNSHELSNQNTASFKIPVKHVAVSKNDVITLPDGTQIVKPDAIK